MPSFRYGQKYVWLFISIICVVSLFICSYYFYKDWKADKVLKEQQEELKTQIENTDVSSDEPFKMPTAGVETIPEEIMNEEYEPIYSPVMLDEYKVLYEQNNDLIGCAHTRPEAVCAGLCGLIELLKSGLLMQDMERDGKFLSTLKTE